MPMLLSKACVAIVLLTLAGCAAPAQYDGLIPIDNAGLQRRLRILCRYGVGDATTRAGCQPPLDQALRERRQCQRRRTKDGSPGQCRRATVPASKPAPR